MEQQEALKILGQVAASFVGNLKDHQAIQASLQFVESEFKALNSLREAPVEQTK